MDINYVPQKYDKIIRLQTWRFKILGCGLKHCLWIFSLCLHEISQTLALYSSRRCNLAWKQRKLMYYFWSLTTSVEKNSLILRECKLAIFYVELCEKSEIRRYELWLGLVCKITVVTTSISKGMHIWPRKLIHRTPTAYMWAGEDKICEGYRKFIKPWKGGRRLKGGSQMTVVYSAGTRNVWKVIPKEEKKYTYLSSCYEVYLNTRKGGKGQTTGRELSYSAEHYATCRQH